MEREAQGEVGVSQSISDGLVDLLGSGYMIVGGVLSTVWLVSDTVAVYNEAGPVSGIFWFFTVGPLIAALKGILWPIIICAGCMGF